MAKEGGVTLALSQFSSGQVLNDTDLDAIVNHLQGASGSTDAWHFRSSSGNNFLITLSDNAGARKFSVRDSDGTEVFSVTSDGALTAVSTSFTNLDIPTSSSPSQTTEGRAVWDSDDDRLTIGTGAAAKVIGLSRGAGSNASATQELMYDTTADVLKVWDGSASVDVGKSVKLVASSDTPVATTSTSATDIVVISGLSIPVTSKVIIEIGHSKDALAAQVTALGVKVNATQVVDSTATTSGTQQAEDGLFIVELGPRTAASPGSLLLTRSSRITATNVEALAAVHSTGGTPAVCPVATITSLTITGLNSTANNNLTVEWYRVWELPV